MRNTMQDILIKAACYIGIIVLGYVLRRTGFFGPEAFGVLSKIVLKITLPCAIIFLFHNGFLLTFSYRYGYIDI